MKKWAKPLISTSTWGSSGKAVIKGFWFPAGSSKQVDAVLVTLEGQFKITPEQHDAIEGKFAELQLSSRVGNIPRKIYLPDRSVFETADNDAIDQLVRSLKTTKQHRGWLHILETRWSWIGISFIAVVMFVFAGFRWGLPWVSISIAEKIPQPVLEQLSSSSLSLLDDLVFAPSDLPAIQQKAVTDSVEKKLTHLNGQDYHIHFRKLGMPNAIALPSGDIVVTDSLVRIASGEELLSVMLHEVSHVKQKHGMQQLVRSSVLSFTIALVAGDASGIEELLIGLPVFLLQSRYSRAHESEADEFALKQLMKMGVDPIHFARIMRKMENFLQQQDETIGSVESDYTEITNQEKKITDYLSTHPVTAERIKRAESLSKEFNQQ